MEKFRYFCRTKAIVMIDRIVINNFKSIQKVDLQLGRLNVLIGANGSGKSNVLEAIGMVAAKNGNTIELDSMAQRGVRIAMPELMVNSFFGKAASRYIRMRFENEDGYVRYVMSIKEEDSIYSPWNADMSGYLRKDVSTEDFESQYSRFLIYSPSIDALRGLSSTSKLFPIGLHGEGLDVLM